jgi:hypothetical protein
MNYNEKVISEGKIKFKTNKNTYETTYRVLCRIEIECPLCGKEIEKEELKYHMPLGHSEKLVEDELGEVKYE